MPKPVTVWITTKCGKFFKSWEYQTIFICLLRNLYAGQEATVRMDMEKLTGSKSRKEYTKDIYFTLHIELICRIYHEKCWAG